MRTRSHRSLHWQILVYVLLGVFALVYLAPFAIQLANSFKTDADASVNGLSRFPTRRPSWRGTRSSASATSGSPTSRAGSSTARSSRPCSQFPACSSTAWPATRWPGSTSAAVGSFSASVVAAGARAPPAPRSSTSRPGTRSGPCPNSRDPAQRPTTPEEEIPARGLISWPGFYAFASR